MIVYIARRLILAAATLLVILFASYGMLRLAPGDPSRSDLFGGGDAGSAVNAEKGGFIRNTALREKLDLDKPLLEGFARWLGRVVRHGDFGESAAVDPGKPVTSMILERLPVTVSLNVWAVLVTYLFAVPVGVWSGTHAGSRGDRIAAFLLFALYSLPVMWVGLMLQALLCEGGWRAVFPLHGLEVPDPDRFSIWRLQFEIVRHYALPVLCLAYGGFASLSRYARAGMIEVINCDYIRTARAKGLKEKDVVMHHALKNAIIPVVTLIGMSLRNIVSGAVTIESVFAITGTGSLLVNSIISRDIPVIQACILIIAVVVVISNLLVDICYGYLDPRIRIQ